MNIFDYWGSFLANCDNEDKELMLIGDLNCDVSKTIPDPHTCKLQFLSSLYQIDQLIKESTRLTPKSATLIDLTLTKMTRKYFQIRCHSPGDFISQPCLRCEKI